MKIVFLRKTSLKWGIALVVFIILLFIVLRAL